MGREGESLVCTARPCSVTKKSRWLNISVILSVQTLNILADTFHVVVHHNYLYTKMDSRLDQAIAYALQCLQQGDITLKKEQQQVIKAICDGYTLPTE